MDVGHDKLLYFTIFHCTADILRISGDLERNFWIAFDSHLETDADSFLYHSVLSASLGQCSGLKGYKSLK